MKKVYVFLQPLFHKRLIPALLKNIGGCYIWINLKNGHKYVGSSIDLVSRIFDHLKGSNSLLLQRAFEKHGHDNFKLIVIVTPNATKELVLVLEQYLIDTLRPEYNILKLAGSSAGAVIGPMSDSQKAKISASKMGHLVSDDTKLRMSISHGGSPVFVYKAETLELLSEHPSAESAAKHLGISGDTVRKYLKSGMSFVVIFFILLL